MGIDSSIYNHLLRAPKSIAEFDAEAMAGQTNRLALQMNQAKMADYQRGMQEESRLAEVYKGATGADGTVDRNKLYSSAAQAGLGAKLPGMQKEHAALDETTTKTKGETLKNDETYIKNVNSKMGQARDMFNTIQTPQQAAQLVQGMYADPDLGKLFAMKGDTAEAAIARIPQDPAKFAEWVQAASLNAEKLASYRTPDANAKLQAKTSTDNNNADNAVQIRGQNQTAATAAASRAQSAQQHKERETRMAAPQAGPDAQVRAGGKPMTALQETKYRTQIAKDYQSANTILSNMDEVAVSAKAVKDAPGLGGATGLEAYFPSYPDGKASQAEVKLANLEGKVTSLGKSAAAMSGAVGPMAVQEWKIVRDMIAAIDPKKGEKSLREQITLVEENAKGAADRIRDAYGKHYSADFERYPQFEAIGSKPPKPPAPKAITAAEYAKLPSGAEFIDDKGQTRRKK